MNTSQRYPEHLEEVLDHSIQFDPLVLECVLRFAKSKPWRGTLAERQEKFRRAHADLATALGVMPPRLVMAGSDDSDSGRSCYVQAINTIILRGRLSVVTFLHEWSHRINGASEVEACRWSVNLFRCCFPKSFARARFDGHLIRRRQA